MKRIVVWISIAAGFLIGASFIAPAAVAQQPQLINPGLELPSAADNIPVTGIAHLPAQLNNGNVPVFDEAASAASTSTLRNIIRCPAADPNNPNCNNIFQWVPLESETAYYRDVIVAAVTYISGATDGETWNVIFTRPSGSQINIGPVSFSSSDGCFDLVTCRVPYD